MAYGNGPQYNSNPRNNGTSYTGNNRFNKSTAPKTNQTNNDVQTDGVLLHNEKMGKFLRTRFWNRFMSIDIGTFQPGAPFDFNVIRNAQVLGGTFSFSVLFELSEICDEVLESLKQTNRFESTATDGNQKKDCIVEISNGSNINMPAGIYLVIYKSVDSGKRTNTFDYYAFSSSRVMRNYDHTTGTSKDDIKLSSEFKKFTLMLREACKSFTMAQAHAVKEASKMDKMGTMLALTAISAGLGVDVNASVNAATSRSSGQSNYKRDNTAPSNGTTPNNYRRTSQPGQWNNRGNYGSNNYNGNGNNFQNQQKVLQSISDEPVDVNLDAATIQQVSLDSFQ